MSMFSASWGNYQERAHKTERETSKAHELTQARIRAKAFEAMDKFDIQQGLLNFEAAVDRGRPPPSCACLGAVSPSSGGWYGCGPRWPLPALRGSRGRLEGPSRRRWSPGGTSG